MNRIVGPQNYRQWIVLAIGAIAMVSFSIGNVAIAEEEKKKKTRRVPAISQSLYLSLIHI